MLGGILSVMTLAVIIITIIATTQAGKAINSITESRASATLDNYVSKMDDTLGNLRLTARMLSDMVSITYKDTSLETYGEIFAKVINEDDMILGSGIWFESGVYNGQEYAGPYWTRDGGNIVYTDEYSNAEYNYFEQDYYKNAKAMTAKQATITDPYYDESSGQVMATCSAPIFDAGGSYIGCITVDTQLSSVQDFTSTMSIGKNSFPILLDSKGTYVYDTDSKKVADSMTIASDENATLSTLAPDVLGTQEGIGEYTYNKEKTMIFWDTVPEVNWKLLVTLQKKEMNSVADSIRTLLSIICVISILVCAAMILILIDSVVKNVKSVNKFAAGLAKGDFTIDEIQTKSRDELGQMAFALNTMFESNRDVISNVSNESERISDASRSLSKMADDLTSGFDRISNDMTAVNDAMMSASAATEEVNASVQEVDTSVQMLSGETNKSKEAAEAIKLRAQDIEKKSKISHDHAIRIVDERKKEIEAANEQAEVVNRIGSLAGAIADIADQINLLSLNASIEAARAGEHGKGFAVVAAEINKLASDTGDAVNKIQETVDAVQQSFENLLGASNELLDFLRETVGPDYENFVNVAKQYGNDAESFGMQSEHIAEMVGNIKAAMGEVSDAIQNIAESAQDTAERSTNITDTVSNVSEVVSDVTDMSGKQNEIAGVLSEVVGQFKLR